jgi:hypothetical protein
LNILLHAFVVPLRYRSDVCRCDCPQSYHAFLAVIASDMGMMQDIDAVIKKHASQLMKCLNCSTDAIVWRAAIRRKVAAVPKFSTILYVPLTLSQAV